MCQTTLNRLDQIISKYHLFYPILLHSIISYHIISYHIISYHIYRQGLGPSLPTSGDELQTLQHQDLQHHSPIARYWRHLDSPPAWKFHSRFGRRPGLGCLEVPQWFKVMNRTQSWISKQSKHVSGALKTSALGCSKAQNVSKCQ